MREDHRIILPQHRDLLFDSRQGSGNIGLLSWQRTKWRRSAARCVVEDGGEADQVDLYRTIRPQTDHRGCHPDRSDRTMAHPSKRRGPEDDFFGPKGRNRRRNKAFRLRPHKMPNHAKNRASRDGMARFFAFVTPLRVFRRFPPPLPPTHPSLPPVARP